MKNVMLDLETMGCGPKAAIIAIGAVAFDPATKMLCDSFYSTVDLESSVQAGGVMDASAVTWWLGQSSEAQAGILVPGPHIGSVLSSFKTWMESLVPSGNTNEILVWGNGSDFDNVILASAYKSLLVTPPWMHWNNRCYRTIKAMHPDIKIVRSGTRHNALDDASNQAFHLMDMLNY